jgi:hypothetical protein
MIGRCAVTCLAAFLLTAVAAEQARADGDPASDVLIVQTVFLPFQAQLPKPLHTSLLQATAEARQAGYPIRVALIATPTDLGAVPSLFQQPQTYAKFLWQELSFVYKGRVLVAMPNGLGLYGGKDPTPAEQKVLKSVPIGAGLNGMAASSLNAVLGLAAAAGHRLSVAPAAVAGAKASSGSRSGDDRAIIGGAVGGALVLTAAAVFLRRRRRLRA